MTQIEVVQIPVLSDNYVYLVKDASSGACAVIDPAVAEPVLAEAEKRGWTITHILNTHWHPDHVGGNLVIKEKTGCKIIGPTGEQEAIPGIDQIVGEGDTIALGTSLAHILDVPGHTRGHIAYHFANAHTLFCGDTLFAMGCGRLFEGTPEQMWTSLAKITALPDETQIYCAHEYTQSNGRFALTVQPNNTALKMRMEKVNQARANNQPTVPFSLGLDRATNPFLTAGSVEEFAQRRAAKDVFQG